MRLEDAAGASGWCFHIHVHVNSSGNGIVISSYHSYFFSCATFVFFLNFFRPYYFSLNAQPLAIFPLLGLSVINENIHP